MLLVTQDDLEKLAFESGATIEIRATRAFVTVGRVTYASQLEPVTR